MVTLNPDDKLVLRLKGADLHKFQYVLAYLKAKESDDGLEIDYVDELLALLDTVLKEESYNIMDGMLITSLLKLPKDFPK